MKKYLYLFGAVALAFFAMSFLKTGDDELEYPDYFSSDLKEAFASQYVETIEDKMVHSRIESELPTFFDEVLRVDLHYTEEGGYHYHSVYAEKDGKKIVRLLKLDKQDDYSSVDFSGLDECFAEPPPGVCPGPGLCCTGPCQKTKPGPPFLLCMLCFC